MVKPKESEMNFTDIILDTPEQEDSSDTKYMEMMISEIFNKKDIELRSRVNQNQIIAISKAQMFATHFNSPLLAAVCQKILELQVSLDGLGRKEFTQIASRSSEMEIGTPNLAERLGFK